MNKLAKFTQIRPVTSMALPEITGRHVGIIDGETGFKFADSRSMTFIERQKQARVHLAGPPFALRAAAATRFLNGEVLEIETTGTGLTAVPRVGVCQTASILVWINSADTTTSERLAGANFAPAARGDLEFPAIWRADLLALVLLPGLYPDYRRFLAMLLRLCIITAREFTTSTGLIDFAQQVTDGRPAAGSLLARVLAARLLFPSWIVADMTGATPLPSTPSEQVSIGVLNALAIGVEAVQLPANLSPAEMQPAALDLTKLPRLSSTSAALPSANATPSEPRLVPIIVNAPAIDATDRTKGGPRSA